MAKNQNPTSPAGSFKLTDVLPVATFFLGAIAFAAASAFFVAGEWKEYQSIKSKVLENGLVSRRDLEAQLDQRLAAIKRPTADDIDKKIVAAVTNALGSNADKSSSYKVAKYRLDADPNSPKRLSLLSHKFCFLSSYGVVYSENNKSVRCTVANDDGQWELQAVGALCAATCVD